MPKTATTSLQTNVFSQHAQISYLGKFPPENIRDFPSAAAQALTAHVLGQPASSPAICRRRVSKWIEPAESNGKIPLWSKEGLTAGSAEHKHKQARRFHEIFADCKIAIFIRHPLKFMESFYFQNLRGFQKSDSEKHHLIQRFGEPPQYFSIENWIETMWNLPSQGAFGHLRCAETAAAYAKVFGKERVQIFLFEKLVENSSETIGDLCRVFGVDPKEGSRLFQQKRQNDRWTLAQTERLKEIQTSPSMTLLFRKSSSKDRKQMLGYDPDAGTSSAPKARVKIPAKWRERTIQFVREDPQRLVEHWGLPLEKYGYPL